ncbi:hypothetical protein LD11_gp266 [Bacillus phage Riley]|uniref:Uncharacterized protein n=2 Tax=Bequatrovirus riley TaxID=1918007 RepID=A0A075M024_9CAUD|nr:hypothetical protein LD11_gp266 [Bacillus phage Riley]AIF72142.1 hypothetical protein [Bacillus phage Riley]ASZ75999.1 hypothetical protein TAFFO16_266 [Bacillus phage Taffo16]ULF48892.1 hypothetical protein [Bacillus phage BillyBob]
MEIREINWNVEFKKEMTELEIYGIERVIDTYYNDEDFDFNTEALGLAYTSSSDYAMYNVCNGEFFYEGYEEFDVCISHFAVTMQGHLVMVTHDENDEEHLFELV